MTGFLYAILGKYGHSVRMPSIATIKLLGLAGVASYAFARLAVHMRLLSWTRYHVVAVPRAGLPTMPRGFAMRRLDAAMVARYETDVPPETRAGRFAQGLQCLGAFNRHDRLVGVVWIGRGPCVEGDVALRLQPPAGAAWDTGMWIHPDHRMGRAFSALWAGIADWLDHHGLDWSYSSITDYNLRSLAAHRRLAMQVLGQVVVLQIGDWQFIAAGDDRWRIVRKSRMADWQAPRADKSPRPRQSEPPSLPA